MFIDHRAGKAGRVATGRKRERINGQNEIEQHGKNNTLYLITEG